jgi:hypothetical protein
MANINTIFGNFNEEQLKTIAGSVDEMVVVLHKMDSLKEELKDILNATYDTTKIPKKILRKMAVVKHKQSFQSEVAEQKQFEHLFEGISELK